MRSNSAFTADALNASWLDFYALFDLAPDAPEDVVRKRLSGLYNEALANANHRDRARRDCYQVLGQQTIPQGRRVLLNAQFRQAYDHQNALHQAGDSRAMDYRTFLASLHEEGISYGDEAPAPAAAVAAPVATEPEPVATLEPEPVAATVAEPAANDRHFLTPTPLDTPLPVTPTDDTLIPAKQRASLRPAAPTGPTSFIQDNLASPRATQKALRDAQQGKKRQKTKYAPAVYAPRMTVSNGDEATAAPADGLFRPGERALSDTSIALMTAIVATMLSITIDYFSIPGMAAWAGIGFAFTRMPSLRQFVEATERQA